MTEGGLWMPHLRAINESALCAKDFLGKLKGSPREGGAFAGEMLTVRP